MKIILTLALNLVFVSLLCAQQDQLTFNHQNIDFSAAPRTTINPMSIKLWDNYNNGGPTAYGTVMEFYGLYGHQTGQFYFAGWDNSKIRYREAFWSQNAWSDWMTLLDSKNNVESTGRLMISGQGDHYINGGNVGIGISNPTSKLDVLGNIKSFNAAFGQTNINTSTKSYANFSSNNHGTVLISSNLFVSDNDDQKIANTHGSMSGASIIIPGNGQSHQGGILFYTNIPGAVSEGQAFTGPLSMAIKANGDVGIGTATPREKLSVNGNIRAREIKVEASNWPDYVFEEDYKVGTLEALESYIKTHKHLPDMPSAKEIDAQGLQLGEMVKMQQKKIEELTLQLIELNKKVSTLQQTQLKANKPSKHK